MTASIPSDVADAFTEMVAVLSGQGKHAGHTREQIGRCVHCSCSARVQGRMATSAGAPSQPKYEVVLADGFVSWRGNDSDMADTFASKHAGAAVREVAG